MFLLYFSYFSLFYYFLFGQMTYTLTISMWFMIHTELKNTNGKSLNFNFLKLSPVFLSKLSNGSKLIHTGPSQLFLPLFPRMQWVRICIFLQLRPWYFPYKQFKWLFSCCANKIKFKVIQVCLCSQTFHHHLGL